MEEINKGHYGFGEGMILGPTMPRYTGGDRQIDWTEAKNFIEKNRGKILLVEAGLAEDWTYTSGTIWEVGKNYIPREESSVYAASRWATPAISVTFIDGTEKTYECWMLGSNADSYFE